MLSRAELIKLECAYKYLGTLKCRFQFNRSEMGPKILYYWPQYFNSCFIHIFCHITLQFFPLRGKGVSILIIHGFCVLDLPTC